MEILHDYRSDGKEQPWRAKKLANSEYANLLAILHYCKTKRVSECADVLRFAITETGHLKLKQTWFCKSRLCPVCAWRRSKLHAANISQIIEEAQKRHKSGRWLFLTLTTKNTTSAQELSDEIAKYSNALRSMLKRKCLKDSVLGFFRGIEVTVNKETGAYNQHMHVLLFVKDSYFRAGNYITQEKWLKLWRKAMKLDYDPSVDVRAIKGSNPEERFKAVLEVAKYPVKSTDYLNGELDDNLKAVDDLENALHRKRLIAYGGLLKDIQKELNLRDVENENTDLIITGDEVEQEAETGDMITATWNGFDKQYYIKK